MVKKKNNPLYPRLYPRTFHDTFSVLIELNSFKVGVVCLVSNVNEMRLDVNPAIYPTLC